MDPVDTLVEESHRLVYVRPIFASELSETLAEAGIEFDDSQILYAVHTETGERMAVFNEREAAFAAARHHGAEPLSVH